MGKTCLGLALWLGLATAVSANTIDVTSQTSQVLHTGDTLAFLFGDSSYARYSASLGMAANPTEVAFSFFSLPVDSTGQFTAALDSVDGSVSQPFAGPLLWTSGVVQMAGYAGSASVLSGNLTLSNTMSQEIFAGSEAELLLTYAGPDITVDMPGYSLNQDLAVSLENSELSIGALNYSVDLTDGPLSGNAVPEPDSARLLLLSGVALCLFSLALKRFRDVPH